MEVTKDELSERQQWPLKKKIEWSVQVLAAYYLHYKGQVYTCFSGGKDSQVVLEIIKRMFSGEFNKYFKDVPIEYGKMTEDCMDYGKIPSVFADTGLEKPEIRKHAMSFDGVTKMRPKKRVDQVIKDEGVALGSKVHARTIREINWAATPNNIVSRTFKLTGIMPSGKKTQTK